MNSHQKTPDTPRAEAATAEPAISSDTTATKPSADELRQQFEAWYAPGGESVLVHIRRGDRYSDGTVTDAWSAYRAGAARVGIAREWPKVLGVCRMTTATKSLQVVFEDRPTDREMDAFDAILRAAAREHPPQREADTGGAATDGQPDSEQA